MQKPSRIDLYISSHPKIAWQLLVLIICGFWQSMLLVVTMVLYGLMIKLLRMRWWMVLSIGIIAVTHFSYFCHEKSFIGDCFHQNSLFWHSLLSGYFVQAWMIFYPNNLVFVLDFSLLIVGILATLDLIPERVHATAFKDIVSGKKPTIIEISPSKIAAGLKWHQTLPQGTFLGVSKYTGKQVVIPDRDINQVALVLGTTGAGKTITLRKFYQHAIEQNYPLIIVDGKPEPTNIAWLMDEATKANKKFLGFNCGNYLHYNCLSKGGFTELKDKIICLKEQWSSDYYRSIAEDYLQTTLEVLLRSDKPFDLQTVADCLDYSELVLMARAIADKALVDRVAKLKLYDTKDITGLQAHLHLLIHSELGEYFLHDNHTISLQDAIDSNALVYFALPALQFPSFATVLGKLVINDIKAVISQNTNKKVFTIFDEFSVFAGEQVLNLVNMGRGKGIHAVFGTQGLGDLKKVNPVFVDQVLNCVNTLLCHRVNDQTSAQMIADWVGTKNAFALTAQFDIRQGSGGAGSVRSTKEYIIHPDQIKQELETGEAFYITKVDGFRSDKVKVKY